MISTTKEIFMYNSILFNVEIASNNGYWRIWTSERVNTRYLFSRQAPSTTRSSIQNIVSYIKKMQLIKVTNYAET